MNWISEEWDNFLQSTIFNCFQHCVLLGKREAATQGGFENNKGIRSAIKSKAQQNGVILTRAVVESLLNTLQEDSEFVEETTLCGFCFTYSS